MTIQNLKLFHQPWMIGILTLTLPLATCAALDAATNDQIMIDNNRTNGAKDMLNQIYSSSTPVKFEQIDVSDIVLSHFPTGTTRGDIENHFDKITSTKAVEITQDKIVFRDNRGQAMLDPDARSIIITFHFDHENKLHSVEALHIKSQ